MWVCLRWKKNLGGDGKDLHVSGEAMPLGQNLFGHAVFLALESFEKAVVVALSAGDFLLEVLLSRLELSFALDQKLGLQALASYGLELSFQGLEVVSLQESIDLISSLFKPVIGILESLFVGFLEVRGDRIGE